MKRFAPRVTILFDGDAAGKKATRASRVPCHEGGLEARVATLPAGMDPDDFVREHGADALNERLKSAHGMLEHLIQEALDGEGFSSSEIDGQKARIRHVLKLLSEEPDENARIMGKRFADVLSKTLVVRGVQGNDLTELERMVGQALSRPAAPVPTGNARKRQPTAVEAIALKTLGAILDFPELLRDPDVLATLQWLEGDFALSIVAVRSSLLGQADSRADLADFLATLPRSIQRFAAGRLASPNFEDIAEAKSELLENTHKLKVLGFQRQDSAARGALEKSASVDDESALLREIEQRARTKRGLDD
jgi:DNA primase